VEDRVDFRALRYIKLIGCSPYSFKYSEWTNLLMIKLPRRSLRTNIPSGELDFVSHSISWWWLSLAICKFLHTRLGESKLVL